MTQKHLYRIRAGGGAGGICNNAEWSLFYEGSLLNLKTTPRNYGFLKRIISANGMVSDAFRWRTRQNEGVTGTYSVISWSANFYWWILHVQSGSAGERYFSWLRSTMTLERFGNLTVLNSHKKRTAKFPPLALHPTPLLKKWSPAPVLQKLLRGPCYIAKLRALFILSRNRKR